jgi:hypothetical protein
MIGTGTRRGYNYIIMEYIDESLLDYLKRHNYSNEKYILVVK